MLQMLMHHIKELTVAINLTREKNKYQEIHNLICDTNTHTHTHNICRHVHILQRSNNDDYVN